MRIWLCSDKPAAANERGALSIIPVPVPVHAPAHGPQTCYRSLPLELEHEEADAQEVGHLSQDEERVMVLSRGRVVAGSGSECHLEIVRTLIVFQRISRPRKPSSTPISSFSRADRDLIHVMMATRGSLTLPKVSSEPIAVYRPLCPDTFSNLLPYPTFWSSLQCSLSPSPFAYR